MHDPHITGRSDSGSEDRAWTLDIFSECFFSKITIEKCNRSMTMTLGNVKQKTNNFSKLEDRIAVGRNDGPPLV